MKTRSMADKEGQIKRLKLDIAVHRKHMATLCSGDSDMLSLLRAERRLLSQELARFEHELRASGCQTAEAPGEDTGEPTDTGVTRATGDPGCAPVEPLRKCRWRRSL